MNFTFCKERLYKRLRNLISSKRRDTPPPQMWSSLSSNLLSFQNWPLESFPNGAPCLSNAQTLPSLSSRFPKCVAVGVWRYIFRLVCVFVRLHPSFLPVHSCRSGALDQVLWYLQIRAQQSTCTLSSWEQPEALRTSHSFCRPETQEPLSCAAVSQSKAYWSCRVCFRHGAPSGWQADAM